MWPDLTAVNFPSWRPSKRNLPCNVNSVLSMSELERKMSTRRTRQELIEQGVLKEVQDNGKSASVIHLMFLHHVVCVWQHQAPGYHTHAQYSRFISTLWQEHCTPKQQVSEACLRQICFHLAFFSQCNMISVSNGMLLSRAEEKWNELCPAAK